MMKKIEFIVLLAALMLAFIAITANAQTSGTCGDGLTWNIDSNGVLTISGSGDMADYSNYKSIPWYDSRNSIEKVVINDGVTSIGERAFYNCTNLTEASAGKDVLSIGKRAFYNCSSLTTVSLGDKITSMGDSVFENCESLTGIIIPDSIEELGEDLFEGCADDFVATVTYNSFAHKYLKDLDYYAYEVYCVINITSGEDIIDSKRLLYQSTYVMPQKPAVEKEGYVFSGWTDGNVTYNPSATVTVSSNLELSALWTMKTFKINFELKTGSNPVPSEKKYWESFVFEFIPARDGYRFLGWSLSENSEDIAYKTGDEYTKNENVVLYAVWKELSYIVSYSIPEAENSIPAQIKMHTEKLQLSDTIPVRSGYTFTGWSTKQEAVLPEYKPGELFDINTDTVLYAVWKNGIVAGDADNNGNVDMTDLILMIKRINNHNIEFSQDNMAAMDVERDTYFNIKDLLKMVQYLAGWQNVILGE